MDVRDDHVGHGVGRDAESLERLGGTHEVGRLPGIEELLAVEARVHQHAAPRGVAQEPEHHRDVELARGVRPRDQLVNREAADRGVAHGVDLPGRTAGCGQGRRFRPGREPETRKRGAVERAAQHRPWAGTPAA